MSPTSDEAGPGEHSPAPGTERSIVLPEQAGGAVVPVRVEALVEMVDAFEKFKSLVLRNGDFWLDKRENKRRVKKSGWLKFALACNVNLEKVGERSETLRLPGLAEPVLTFHFDYRAVAPSGRYTEASGSASLDERMESDKIVHDTRSLAQTRAMNRAISHLVGGGEVSAEEVEGARAAPGQAGAGAALAFIDQAGVLDALEKAGLDTTVLDIYPESDRYVVKPQKFLGDVWARYNEALAPMGFTWIRAGKDGRWELELHAEP